MLFLELFPFHAIFLRNPFLWHIGILPFLCHFEINPFVCHFGNSSLSMPLWNCSITSKEFTQRVPCIGRESNPGLPRGRREFYHWTTNACAVYPLRCLSKSEELKRIVWQFAKKHICNSQDLVNSQDRKEAGLPVGESNPGLPRDKRGYSPLY